MTDEPGSQVAQKPRRKQKQKAKVETRLDIEETFDPATAKDKDFDLDLSAATFQGKKGQAGTRTKNPNSPPAGDPRSGTEADR